MKPTTKTESMEKVFKNIFGVDRKDTIIQDKCTMCETPNINFRNEISKREYCISGLCQNCQDDIFGKD